MDGAILISLASVTVTFLWGWLRGGSPYAAYFQLWHFLAALFGIAGDVRALEGKHHELAPLYAVKRLFVQRKAMNTHPADAAARPQRVCVPSPGRNDPR